MRYLMGIDNGGTFSKAAIFDAEGNQVAVASEPTKTLTPKPGYTERNMTELWEVNARVIRTAILQSGVDPRQIRGRVLLRPWQGAVSGRGGWASRL